MSNAVYWIDGIFKVGQLVNAGMFLGQLILVIQKRSAKDMSLISFVGFAMIQFITLLHGYFHKDKLLTYGSLAGLGFCVSLILTALYFRGIYLYGGKPK